MRVVMFLMSFFFLLLGRGETVFTPNNNIIISLAQYHQNNKQNDIANDNQTITLIEDTDIDLEEECQSSNDVKERSGNHFFSGKYSLTNTLYCSTSKKFTLNYCENRTIFLPYLSGNYNPIYITQRVLRI